MLHVVSWILVMVYLAMPVGYCLWAVRRRTGRGRRVFSAVVTLAVGFLIGISLCGAVAAMTGVNPLVGVAWGEALLAGYFVSGVILTLRLGDALLRAALTRTVRQRGPSVEWLIPPPRTHSRR
jgi:putative copper export protein